MQAAVEAVRTEQAENYAEAAQMYDVAQSTLAHRLNRRPTHRDAHIPQIKVKPHVEDKVVDWLGELDS